jgi:uncharacterized protein DUF4145
MRSKTSKLRSKNIKDSGEVPAYVAEWGEHVRALGNDAAHRPDFSQEEAKEAIAFAEELVRSLFTRPKEIELVRKKYEAKAANEDSSALPVADGEA